MSLALHRDFGRMNKVIDDFDFFSDLPFGGTPFFQDAIIRYPSAKFLLVVRDDHDWLKSLLNMIDINILNGRFNHCSLAEKVSMCFKEGRYGFSLWMESFCDGEINEHSILAAKRRYEREVIALFSDQKNFQLYNLNQLDEYKLKLFLGIGDSLTLPHYNKGLYT